MVYKYIKTPLRGEISDYEDGALRLHKVDETKWERYWNKLVNEHHYLGFESSIGGRIKYIITLEEFIIGAISFCSAAYHLAHRDSYIGWDEETRRAMLPHFICNNRFLILPWVHIRNLASQVLAMSLRHLCEDWEKQYEIAPYMVETFVDPTLYTGTCYKAANWTYLGKTKGYAKIGDDFVYHGQKKDLYVYIVNRQFAKQFKPTTSRIKNEEEELREMINGIPMWHQSLLKDLGLTNNPAPKIIQKFTAHLMRYTPYLGRSENKLHFTAMIQGLLSDLKRKCIEPIAIAFEGIDSVRNLTNFMSRSKWDTEGMKNEYQTELSAILSHEEGMITGDDTGFPKKGSNSVGVARQYCGNTGKVDNCQSSVMVGYASEKGYGLADYSLYMPEKWFNASHERLRSQCGVPSIKFKTKNEMLLELIENVVRTGLFPAKYVGVDSAFGSDSDFLDKLPESLIYFADIRSNQQVFADRPDTFAPPYSGRGRRPVKQKATLPTLSVKKVIDKSKEPWERVVLGIGAKGAIFAEDKCLQVVEVRNGLPGKEVWLYARKLDDGTIKYALCNAKSDATKEEIRKPALMRWSIEQCFKECKDYLGMDHYEARSWDAWHRHILLTLIAHLFVIKLRIEFSRTPNTPSSTPYIYDPVLSESYLEAYEQMGSNQKITTPNIFTMPVTPQQFLTIGLIVKLVSSVFPKMGDVVRQIDYQLYKAAVAFESHSVAAVERELMARAEFS